MLQAYEVHFLSSELLQAIVLYHVLLFHNTDYHFSASYNSFLITYRMGPKPKPGQISEVLIQQDLISLTDVSIIQVLLQRCYITTHPSHKYLFPCLCIVMLTTVQLTPVDFGVVALCQALTWLGLVPHGNRSTGNSRGWCWETTLHGSLTFLCVLCTGALTAFILHYSFIDSKQPSKLDIGSPSRIKANILTILYKRFGFLKLRTSRPQHSPLWILVSTGPLHVHVSLWAQSLRNQPRKCQYACYC